MTTMKRGNNWKISVYGREHGVPHVHITGPDFRATLEIATGALLTGQAPAAVLLEARGWLATHKTEALMQWRTLNPGL